MQSAKMSDIFDIFIATLNNSYSLPRYAIGALPKGKKNNGEMI